jgi:hypothetical protein
MRLIWISMAPGSLMLRKLCRRSLPAEARGTFLRRVVTEVREGQSFKDSDIERAVRVALFDQPIKQVSVSSTDQGGGKLRSDTPTVSEKPLPSHPPRIPPAPYGFRSPQRISKVIQFLY